MDPVKLVVGVHPSIVYYAKAQGFITLALAAALLCLLGIVVQQRERTLKNKSNWMWVLAGGVLALFLAFEGFWSLSIEADSGPVTLEGAKLTVGNVSVDLDDSTEMKMFGVIPAFPEEGEQGYTRLPGAKRFPPFFTGGNALEIKTAKGAVKLWPIALGPSAYLQDNANPAADQLLARLAPFAKKQEPLQRWLERAATPAKYAAGAPKSEYSFSTFLIFFLIFSVPIVGGLAGINVMLLRKGLNKNGASAA